LLITLAESSVPVCVCSTAAYTGLLLMQMNGHSVFHYLICAVEHTHLLFICLS